MTKSPSLRVPVADAIAAEDAMSSAGPEASDETIAGIVADYLLTKAVSGQRALLSIIHDVRPSSLLHLERMREKLGSRCNEPGRIGPCPLPHDWARMNVVGISTRDRDRARQWIVAATLAGYCVFYSSYRDGSGGGQGSLAAIRARRRGECEREARMTDTLDDDEAMAELEALIAAPDPAWWDYDMLPWDYLFPQIPF